MAKLIYHQYENFDLRALCAAELSFNRNTVFLVPSEEMAERHKKYYLDEHKILFPGRILSFQRWLKEIAEKNLNWRFMSDAEFLLLAANFLEDMIDNEQSVFFAHLLHYKNSLSRIVSTLNDWDRNLHKPEKPTAEERDLQHICSLYRKYCQENCRYRQSEVYKIVLEFFKLRPDLLPQNLSVVAHRLSRAEEKFFIDLSQIFSNIRLHYVGPEYAMLQPNGSDKAVFSLMDAGFELEKIMPLEAEKRNEEINIFPTAEDEIRQTLRRIKNLLATGERPLDIIVTSFRGSADWQKLDYWAGRYDIPLSVSVPSLGRNPLLNKVLLPIKLHTEDYRRELILELVDYLGPRQVILRKHAVRRFFLLSPYDAGLQNYESFLSTLRPSNDADKSAFSKEDLGDIRAALEFFRELESMWPRCGNFAAYRQALGEVRRKVNKNAASMHSFRELNTVMDNAIDELNHYFWPDKMSLADFRNYLLQALNTFRGLNLGDGMEKVRCLSPENSLWTNAKYRFVLGLNEDNRLQSGGVDFADGSSSAQQDVMYTESVFKILATEKCHGKTCLSYVAGNLDGDQDYQAEFLRIYMAKRNLELTPVERLVASQEELLLMAVQTNHLNAVDQELLERAEIERGREEGRRDQYGGVIAARDTSQWLKDRYNSDREMSATALEEYGKCPHSFMFRRIFNLEEVREADLSITPLDRGSIIHQVLSDFMSKYMGVELNSIPFEDLITELSVLLEKQIRKLIATGVIAAEWASLERKRFKYILHSWLENEIDLQNNSRFRPFALEYKFRHTALTGNSKPRNEKLLYAGFIDRMDEDGTNFVIYDYKTGNPPNMKGIEAGTAFQLPLYIKAAAAEVGKEPAGGGYYELRGKFERNIGIYVEDAYTDLHFTGSKGKLSKKIFDGVLDRTIRRAVWYRQRMRSGKFPLKVLSEKSCSYCQYRDICRHKVQNTSREGEEI